MAMAADPRCCLSGGYICGCVDGWTVPSDCSLSAWCPFGLGNPVRSTATYHTVQNGTVAPLCYDCCCVWVRSVKMTEHATQYLAMVGPAAPVAWASQACTVERTSAVPTRAHMAGPAAALRPMQLTAKAGRSAVIALQDSPRLARSRPIVTTIFALPRPASTAAAASGPLLAGAIAARALVAGKATIAT